MICRRRTLVSDRSPPASVQKKLNFRAISSRVAFVSDEAASRAGALNEVERRIVDFCCDGVRILGLPKSIGEIYGLLFISRRPQSLDDLVVRLGSSKGSASQGLKLLRTLGAIRQVDGTDSRRAYYEADIKLKSLVGGFVREEVRPHLRSGDAKLEAIAAATVGSALAATISGRRPYQRPFPSHIAAAQIIGSIAQ